MAKVIDLRPQALDLKLYAGDGPVITLTVTDVNNDPVNVTGTIEAQIRAKREDTGSPLESFDVDATNASDGVVKISLTKTQTAALCGSSRKFNGFWDIQWTPSGEEPRTLCQGKVECDLDVSR